MVGVYDGPAVIAYREPAGQATVTDRVEIDLDWDLKASAIVGEPKIVNAASEVRELRNMHKLVSAAGPERAATRSLRREGDRDQPRRARAEGHPQLPVDPGRLRLSGRRGAAHDPGMGAGRRRAHGRAVAADARPRRRTPSRTSRCPRTRRRSRSRAATGHGPTRRRSSTETVVGRAQPDVTGRRGLANAGLDLELAPEAIDDDIEVPQDRPR